MCTVLAAVAVFAAACGSDETGGGDSGVTKKSWAATETVAAAGAVLDYTFTATGRWTARSSQPEWCRVSTGSGDAGANGLRIEVGRNTAAAARTATVRIEVAGASASSFTVKQSGGSAAQASGIVRKIDEDLRANYLWNDEYKTLSPDYSTPYANEADNFLVNTLMTMKTNTLDKKRADNGYRLYSNMTRTAAGSHADRASSRAGVRKESVLGYGFVSMTPVKLDRDGKIGFCVLAVYPDSPASEAGLTRGSWILKIDGADITEADYEEWFRRLVLPTESKSLRLTVAEQIGAAERSVSVASRRMEENPVFLADVIETGGRRIGYLVYEKFDAAFDEELAEAFDLLKSRGATDLVLDLRANGGGHVLSANMMASCIAGSRSQNRVFAYYRYNGDRMKNVDATAKETGHAYDRQAGKFYEHFAYADYPNLGGSLAAHALGLARVYVLVSPSTASASELVINALKGIDVDVVLIGERSEGKNVGMEAWSATSDGYEYQVAPITFQTYNARGNGDYQNGFDPDYEVYDWNWTGPVDGTYYFDGYLDFGDPEEPLLAKAVQLITGEKRVAAAVPGSRAGVREAVALETPAVVRRLEGMIVLRGAAADR